jgi:hypothetical protein
MFKVILAIATGMLIAGSSGCAAWTNNKPNKKNSMWSSMQFWKKPYQKPQKLVAIWSPDVLTMTGKPPTRGFGGRLYFYNEKSQAIPVDGELVVHGYAEKRLGRKTQSDKVDADKTFVFTAEQFTQHFSSSELGASYSIWIPWDVEGGMQQEITLIPTFKAADNSAVVQGEAAKLILPGKKPDQAAEQAPESVPFQQVSYQQTRIPTNTAPLANSMATTTINIPANLRRPESHNNRSGSEYSEPSAVTVGGTSTETSGGHQPNNASVYGGAIQAPRALTLGPNIGYPSQIAVPSINSTQATTVGYTLGGASNSGQTAPITQPATQLNANNRSAPFPSTAPPVAGQTGMPNQMGIPSQLGVPNQITVPKQLNGPGLIPNQSLNAIPVAASNQWQPIGGGTNNLQQTGTENRLVQPVGFTSPSSTTTVPTANVQGLGLPQVQLPVQAGQSMYLR